MARIASVAPALPTNVYAQSDITAAIGPMITSSPAKRAVLDRMHGSSRVATRHLAMPLEEYIRPRTFTETNQLFIGIAADLAEKSLTEALDRAGLAPEDLDYLVYTSITGISAPSIDALLVARMGLRRNIKRIPIYGLGCVAGAAGIARVADYLRGHPGGVAALVSVELCSLTFQRDDDSMANFIASGLFGDGAAAVVMVGDERAARMAVTGPDIVDTASAIYPDSEEVIGFDTGETGFRIVLTPRVAQVVATHFEIGVSALLGENGYTVDDIDNWVAHPGGPKVLEVFHDSLGLADGDLALSWDSLSRLGNLSSSSVLHILADSIEGSARAAGETTALFALGPGVAAEVVLLRWPS